MKKLILLLLLSTLVINAQEKTTWKQGAKQTVINFNKKLKSSFYTKHLKAEYCIVTEHKEIWLYITSSHDWIRSKYNERGFVYSISFNSRVEMVGDYFSKKIEFDINNIKYSTNK